MADYGNQHIRDSLNGLKVFDNICGGKCFHGTSAIKQTSETFATIEETSFAVTQQLNAGVTVGS